MAHPEVRPLDTLLAAFAAGRLSEAFAVLVAAHLELKSESRAFIGHLEVAGGILLDEIEPVALNARDCQLASIFAAPAETSAAWRTRNWYSAAVVTDELIPPTLRSFAGCEFDELEWDTVVPGLRRCTIASDRSGESSFMRCRAGKRIPRHRHEGLEAVLVLQGGLGNTAGHYLRGDVAIADEAVAHQPVADPNEECIYFVAREGAARYADPVADTAQPRIDD
jgi:putative transcriptional regulator